MDIHKNWSYAEVSIQQLEAAVRNAIRIGRKFDETAVLEHRRKLLVELEDPKDDFEEFFWMLDQVLLLFAVPDTDIPVH